LSCDETGKCHIDDDMGSIIANVRDADRIAFFSPTRWSLLSGDLKVMLDRLNPLAAKEELIGKKAIAICIGQTEAGIDSNTGHALDSIRFFCENAGILFVGECAISNCLVSGDALEKKADLANASELFQKLLESETI
jgi:multimeric flavodoxin WrbA